MRKARGIVASTIEGDYGAAEIVGCRLRGVENNVALNESRACPFAVLDDD
jgi:hypothetical protein